jgi:hypothetical protein
MAETVACLTCLDEQRGKQQVGGAGMSQKRKIDSLGSCFRLEDDRVFFSVAEFVRVNKLRDDPQLRKAVVEELREMFPNLRVVEEEN